MPYQNGLPESYQISIGAHEERLLRVESTLQDVVSQASRIALQQEYIAEKIDSGFEAVAKTQDSIAQRLDKHEIAVDKELARLEPLEADAKASTARADFFKKIMMSGLLAGIGAVGVKVVEWLLK